MSIKNRVDNLVEEFGKLTDWEDRYKHIIQKGKKPLDMEESHKVEKTLSRGANRKCGSMQS